MKKSLCLIVTVLLLFFSLLSEAMSAEVPQYGGTLTILYARAVNTFDLHKDVGAGAIPIINHITESFIGLDDHGNMIPMLATAMPKISNDGLEYTFTLRKGVKFHDGSDFTAEDVKFTFDRVLNPDVSTQSKKVGEFIESVTILDPYGVKIRLKKSWVDFLTVMAEDKVFDFINAASVKKLGKDFGSKGLVGTGPFKFEEWKKGSSVVIVKNPSYWKKGVPYLDKIVWREVSEDTTRILAFLSGEGDVLLQAPFKEVAELKKKKNVKIHETESGEIVGVWFNTRKPPMNDKKIRQALSMAIDRKAIMDSIYYGFGTTARGFLPAYFKEYQTKRDPYNVKEARRLLEEQGYTKSNPLKFELMYRAEESFQEVATLIQAMWNQVNVNVELKPVQGAGIQQLIFGEDPPFGVMCMRILGGMSLFDHTFRMYASGSYLNTTGVNKKGGYQNPRIEELLNRVVGELDKEKARKMLEELSEIIFLEDVPIAHIGSPSNIDVTYDYVRNWFPDVSDYSCHANVWLAKKK